MTVLERKNLKWKLKESTWKCFLHRECNICRRDHVLQWPLFSWLDRRLWPLLFANNVVGGKKAVRIKSHELHLVNTENKAKRLTKHTHEVSPILPQPIETMCMAYTTCSHKIETRFLPTPPAKKKDRQPSHLASLSQNKSENLKKCMCEK